MRKKKFEIFKKWLTSIFVALFPLIFHFFRYFWNVFQYFKIYRSFDSQNNNRGGYNVGDDGAIYYYANSILPIQWYVKF